MCRRMRRGTDQGGRPIEAAAGTHMERSSLFNVLRLRLNRRWFWSGMALLVLVTAATTKVWPWLLNGGFAFPWLFLHAARMRDFGARGIWAGAVMIGALTVLVQLATRNPPQAIYAVTAGVTFLALIGFTVWVGLKRGDVGANRFGPPPAGWRLALAKAS
jgi:uncharacterized membrane protein YhaH (DUF805 family)